MSPSHPKSRHEEVQALLERLHLGGMAAVFADLALRAAKENLSHEAYLCELAKHEEELRTQRRTARLLRASGLPQDKTFRHFPLSKWTPALLLQIERLKGGDFLSSATNVILAGKPGVGKSHIAAALGYELIVQGHAVLWIPTANLV
jgi:DNA replication protein DnaC